MILKELQQARSDGKTHRELFLTEQIEIYKLLGQKNPERILRNIKRVEELWLSYGHIASTLTDKAQGFYT